MKRSTRNVLLIVASVAVLVGVGAAVFALRGTPAGDEQPAASTTTETDEHGDHDLLVPAPTSTPDHAGAAAAAIDALKAYARNDLDYTTWFAQLKPYLDETAIEAYSTVQPVNIPKIVITGDAVTTETSTDTYAVVNVPTSTGKYVIELRRDDPESDWGVTRLQPSE